jgi:uncharacterized protein (TIGR02996 family)
MSDEKALLEAIWEHPHEDTPRLMYADWLQEHGQTDRAEFIRVQCELALLDHWSDGLAELQAREKALWEQNAQQWRVDTSAPLRAHFKRGLPRIELSDCGMLYLLALKPKDLRVAPLSYYRSERRFEFDAFLKWPCAVFQERFEPGEYLPRGWTDRLIRCKKLRNVSEVAFTNHALAVGEIKVILDTWADWHLRSLTLNGAIGDIGVGVVAGHRAVARVYELDLRGVGLSAKGVRALGHSPHLKSVRFLTLNNNPFGDAGATELAGSPLLAWLRSLNATRAQIGDAGAAALANSLASTNLRSLCLFGNPIGADGLRALARSPFLGNIKWLVVDNTPNLDPALAKELRDRFGEAVHFH